jgi:N6-adenosine-specific RNA methylase IME4
MYQVIYCDPPWAYGNKQLINGKIKNPKDAYPTMNIEQLMKFEIPETTKDAVMLMWVTAPTMEASIQLGNAWGFDYKTVAFVWDKCNTNPGFYTNSQTEFVLLFKKKGGKIPTPNNRKQKQFLSEKRREHSRKPDEIRTRIERMYPEAKRVELFARTTTPGWDVMGNEVNKYD